MVKLNRNKSDLPKLKNWVYTYLVEDSSLFDGEGNFIGTEAQKQAIIHENRRIRRIHKNAIQKRQRIPNKDHKNDQKPKEGRFRSHRRL